MDPSQTTLSILTAMITPAVLISAAGALILSTSLRLGRVVDRVRTLSAKFEELVHTAAPDEFHDERKALTFDLLDKLTSRARLLQRSITMLYVALGVFVGTSVTIGVASVLELSRWIPVVLTLIGMGFLLYGSILLIIEARLALAALHAEMDFLWKMGQQNAPPELREALRRMQTRSWTGRRAEAPK